MYYFVKMVFPVSRGGGEKTYLLRFIFDLIKVHRFICKIKKNENKKKTISQ